MRLLFDSTTPARSIPADATLILAYIDGANTSGNMSEARASHPNARLISCSVVGTPGASVYDIEKGNLTPESGARVARSEVHAGRHPTLYANASTWPQVDAELAKVGLTRGKQVEGMVAKYDGDPTIPPGFVAKQYRSDTAQNLDYSVVADYWPGVDAIRPTPTTRKPLMDREGLISFLANSICARDATAEELTQFGDPMKTSDRAVVVYFEDSTDGTQIKLSRRAAAGLH